LAGATTKLDPEAVKPLVPLTVNSLVECFKVESWPVRDQRVYRTGRRDRFSSVYKSNLLVVFKSYSRCLKLIWQTILCQRAKTLRHLSLRLRLHFPLTAPSSVLVALELLPLIGNQAVNMFGTHFTATASRQGVRKYYVASSPHFCRTATRDMVPQPSWPETTTLTCTLTRSCTAEEAGP
jgi:hypothetical protein